MQWEEYDLHFMINNWVKIKTDKYMKQFTNSQLNKKQIVIIPSVSIFPISTLPSPQKKLNKYWLVG